MAGQRREHGFALPAQFFNEGGKLGVFRRLRREDGAQPARFMRRVAQYLPQIQTEPDGGTSTAKGFAHAVIASAARDGGGRLRHVGGEHDAAVIVIAAQVGQIQADGQSAQRVRQRLDLDRKSVV